MPVLHLKDEDQYKKVVGTLLKWGCGIEARNGTIIVAPGQYRALLKLGLIDQTMQQNGSPARGQKKKT